MSIVEFFQRLITARSTNKDIARRTSILHVLLIGSVFLAFVAFLRNCILVISSGNLYYSLTPPITFGFLLILISLFVLSKKGHPTLSAVIYIAFLFISAFYTSLLWGADVPQSWLMFSLIIIISGILVGTRFAIFATFLISIGTILISFFQLNGYYHPTTEWKQEQYTMSDTIVRVATLFVIGLVSWLFNREIEKSLRRARSSEAALKRQRDMLEIKVEERTKALKQAQLEKVAQLYRFAEIGRLSSSLFHDLVTPLALISLNLEKLKHKQELEKIEDMQALVKRAIKGTRYLETFVVAVRQQLQNQESKKMFSLQKEIKQVLNMLFHKAKIMKVKIILEPTPEIKLYGNQVKFCQLMINLLLNALDSYEGISNNEKKKEVHIRLETNHNTAVITIKDSGAGINAQNLKRIFQPFFTTKTAEKGTGIGLSISRDIVEKSFQGKIAVQSSKKSGTIFTIRFPLIKKGNNERTVLLTSTP